MFITVREAFGFLDIILAFLVIGLLHALGVRIFSCPLHGYPRLTGGVQTRGLSVFRNLLCLTGFALSNFVTDHILHVILRLFYPETEKIRSHCMFPV